MLRTRTFLDPHSVDMGRPVERTVIELETPDIENTRFVDLYDLREWRIYDIVFRALPSTPDYKRVYGGLSYSLKTERHKMPESFDEAYMRAENWIKLGQLPKNIMGHHKHHNMSGQYDAFEGYIHEWSGDNMTPPLRGARQRYKVARSGRP